MARSPSRQQRGRHQHHMCVIKYAGSHAYAQKLVGDVSGNLRRAADAIQIALPGVENQVGRPLEGLRIENRQGLLKRVNGCPEDLLCDLQAGVFG